MKKEAHEYLFNEALKYLGKYPATRKKSKNIFRKKSKIKRLMLEQFSQKESIKRK